MKTFTIAEANQLLPRIRMKLQMIQRSYAFVGRYKEGAMAAAAVSERNGGMPGGSNYVRHLYDIGKLTTEIADSGVQLKDYKQGLIDFPFLYEGRIVLLCWKLGEPDTIAWWHEIETGFAGRRSIDLLLNDEPF